VNKLLVFAFERILFAFQDNEDIIEAAWVPIEDKEKWDDYTLPILEIYLL
jgi:hypothetical protein